MAISDEDRKRVMKDFSERAGFYLGNDPVISLLLEDLHSSLGQSAEELQVGDLYSQVIDLEAIAKRNSRIAKKLGKSLIRVGQGQLPTYGDLVTQHNQQRGRGLVADVSDELFYSREGYDRSLTTTLIGGVGKSSRKVLLDHLEEMGYDLSLRESPIGLSVTEENFSKKEYAIAV